MKPVAFCALWFCFAGEVRGQSSATSSTFEVASVKASASGMPNLFIRVNPAGGLSISGATLKNLISYAYGVRAFQISGGPTWADTERFDIEARANGDQKKTGERLRALLGERFQLVTHTEVKEETVYALVTGKNGPKLQASTDAANFIRKLGRGEIKGQGVGLSMLVLNLSYELERLVIDKTGLEGKYDFDLKWSSAQPEDADEPSIFTALQEQLGLRLESEKGPVKALVIDGAEKPSKN